MRDATFRQPLLDRFRTRMANGYDLASGPPQSFEIIGVAPAGALTVSGTGMAKFMIAHLHDGAYGGRRGLAQETDQPLSPSLPARILREVAQRASDHRARRRQSTGGSGVIVLWLYRTYGWNAGRTQLVLDEAVLLTSLIAIRLDEVLWSLLGLIATAGILFRWHRLGRLTGY